MADRVRRGEQPASKPKAQPFPNATRNLSRSRFSSASNRRATGGAREVFAQSKFGIAKSVAALHGIGVRSPEAADDYDQNGGRLKSATSSPLVHSRSPSARHWRKRALIRVIISGCPISNTPKTSRLRRLSSRPERIEDIEFSKDTGRPTLQRAALGARIRRLANLQHQLSGQMLLNAEMKWPVVS
jgi:hypothetical protein